MRSGKNNYVFSISGAHGVGKTTIFNKLESKYVDNSTFKFYPERYIVKNPTYPLGSIKKEVAFRGEIFFLQQLVKRNTRLRNYLRKNSNKIIIMDRTPLCVLIYSKALELISKDYKLILDMYKSIDWVPEHIIYLTAEPSIIIKRIVSRGQISLEKQDIAEMQRKKWHERDRAYLLKVLKFYDEILLSKENRNKNFSTIQTNELSPSDVVKKIENIIFEISNYSYKRQFEKSQIDMTKFL
jgi:thymidylate kinase